MIFMPLEPLANEVIQVHSILYALAHNNAIINITKLMIDYLPFVARISNCFVAVTNLVSIQLN